VIGQEWKEKEVDENEEVNVQKYMSRREGFSLGTGIFVGVQVTISVVFFFFNFSFRIPSLLKSKSLPWYYRALAMSNYQV
jgi:hypothetical protein